MLALGDGNWKMGEGIQVGQSSKAGGDVSEVVVLEHFLRKYYSNKKEAPKLDVVNPPITQTTS